LEHWRDLQQRRVQGSLPHALLLEGPEGVGKAAFALALAASVLCSKPDSEQQACGQCEACHLFAADTHPDFKLVEPGDKPAIRVRPLPSIRFVM
jgi:DNA polymerase-3 subunit delta'